MPTGRHQVSERTTYHPLPRCSQLPTTMISIPMRRPTSLTLSPPASSRHPCSTVADRTVMNTRTLLLAPLPTNPSAFTLPSSPTPRPRPRSSAEVVDTRRRRPFNSLSPHSISSPRSTVSHLIRSAHIRPRTRGHIPTPIITTTPPELQPLIDSPDSPSSVYSLEGALSLSPQAQSIRTPYSGAPAGVEGTTNALTPATERHSSTCVEPCGHHPDRATRTNLLSLSSLVTTVGSRPHSQCDISPSQLSFPAAPSNPTPLSPTPESQHSPVPPWSQSHSCILEPPLPSQDKHRAPHSAPSRLFTSSMSTVSLSRALCAHMEVQFDTGVVDISGGPNTSTSYSLPGTIYITFSSLPTWLEGYHRQLTDCTLVLEGKSEFWDNDGRYIPMRLHTSTLPLIPTGAPLQIPPYNLEKPLCSTFTIALAFDLRVPGWLPASHAATYGLTAYGVVATAQVGWKIDYPATHRNSFLANHGSLTDPGGYSIGPAAKRSRTSFYSSLGYKSGPLINPNATEQLCSRYTPFLLRRHRIPATITNDGVRHRHFSIESPCTGLPYFECVVTLPELVDTFGEERSLNITLRMRAKPRPILDPVIPDDIEMDDGERTARSSEEQSEFEPSAEEDRDHTDFDCENPSDCWRKRVSVGRSYIKELGMEVVEIERFSSTPSRAFLQAFPIPKQQPTRFGSAHRLLGPRSPHADKGSILGDTPAKIVMRRKCLLTDQGCQRNFCFPGGGLLIGTGWRRLNVTLPLPAPNTPSVVTRPRPHTEGPFVRLNHELKIRMVCYGDENCPETTLTLSTPIRFATCLGSFPENSTASAPPAYVQVFHENGEPRECDPLPLYTPPARASGVQNIGSTSSPMAADGSATPYQEPSYVTGESARPEVGPSPLLPRTTPVLSPATDSTTTEVDTVVSTDINQTQIMSPELNRTRMSIGESSPRGSPTSPKPRSILSSMP